MWSYVAVLLLGGTAMAAAPSVLPARLSALRATKISVDHQNNLWAWNAATNVVTRIAVDGTRTDSGELPAGYTVDADDVWGIAVLATDGHAIDVFDWRGHVIGEVKLPEPVGDLAWIGPRQIAVTPQFAPHRIEVWDVQRRSMTGTIGPRPVLVPTPGAAPAHAVLVRFDAARQEIVTLDGFTGELIVYTPAGGIVRTARLENPDQASLSQWLARNDASSKAKREVFRPLLWTFPTLTIDREGAVWVGERSDPAGSVAAFRIGRDGSLRHVTLRSPDCPSIRFASWQDYMIFFRDAKMPQVTCTGVRRQ